MAFADACAAADRLNAAWPLVTHAAVPLSLCSALLRLCLQTGAPAPLIAEDVNDIIQRNAAKLDDAIDYQRDFE